MMQTILVCLAVTLLSSTVQGTCLSGPKDSFAKEVSREDLNDAILKYTLNQYKQMVSDEEFDSRNLFTSPYSIWVVLAVTYLGARGRSSDELANVLGLKGLDKSGVEDEFIKLQKALKLNDKVFTSASMLAFDRRIRILNCVSSNPLVDLASLNFQYDTFGSANRVNRWVSEKTKNRIKSLLTPQSISSDTLMVLLNAVYFNGTWKYQFSPQETYKDYFRVSPKEVREVDMMKLQTLLRHYRSKKLKASSVELPYYGDQYSMILVLPDDQFVDINEFIKSLTVENIKSFSSSFREKSVTIYLPRITIEESYNMNKIISDLGADNIFDSIDLGGFTAAAPPMKVSNIVHKSFIRVFEEGTEAAASTAAVTTTRGRDSHVELKFNHPHLYMIKDNINDVILFMGIFRKPQGTSFKTNFK